MTNNDRDPETNTKMLEGHHIVDWKHGKMQRRKTKPTNISPMELAIPASTDVHAPEIRISTIEAAIDAPAAQTVIEETQDLAREKGPVDDDG